MTITTTLNAIRAHRPCEEGWTKLLAHLGKTKADDDPLPLLTILDSNGAADTIWCFRALGPEHHKWIIAVTCDIAERALRFMPAGETRPREAIETTRAWLRGEATIEQVRESDAAACAFAFDVADAADADAYAAALDAYAAYAACDAAYAACDAADGDDDDAACDAERIAQAEIIRRHLT